MEFQSMSPSKNTSDAKSFLEVYSSYNTALRNWFISVGVGGPAFLLTDNPFSVAILKTDKFKYIIMLFVLGLAIQILVVFINKHMAWINYAAKDVDIKNKPSEFWKSIADRVSEMYWIDLIADILSVLLFAYAILVVFQVGI